MLSFCSASALSDLANSFCTLIHWAERYLQPRAGGARFDDHGCLPCRSRRPVDARLPAPDGDKSTSPPIRLINDCRSGWASIHSLAA